MGIKIDNKKKAGKSVGFFFYDLVRKDTSYINKVMYWMIIIIFILDYIWLALYAIVGFRAMGYFGPISETLGLGYTNEGLFIELLFTVCITAIFATLMREKLRYIENNK